MALESPILIKEGFKTIHLAGNYDFIKTDKMLSVEQMGSIIQQNVFFSKAKFNVVRDKNYYCLSFSVRNITNQLKKIILKIDEPKIDSLQLFIYNGSQLKNCGISSNFDKSKISIGSNLRREYDVFLKPNITYTLFFSINNRTSLLRLRLPINLIEPKYYDSIIFKEKLFEEVYIGTMFFVFVFSVLLLFIFFERLFLSYSLYLLGLIFFYFSMENYVVYFAEQSQIFLFTQLIITSAYGLIFWGYCIFSEQILNTNIYVPKRILKIWGYLKTVFWIYFTIHLLGTVIVGQNLPTIKFALFFIIPTFLIFIFIFIFYSLKHNNKVTYLFLIGFLCLFFNYFLVDLSGEAGFAGDNIVYFFYASHIIELLALTLGLILRFKIVQDEREHFRIEIIQKNQKIIQTELQAQETERSRIAQDLHDEVGNSLAALKNIIAQNFKSSLIAERVSQIAQDVRNISHNLASINFDKTTLSEAFQNLINRHNEAENIAFEYIEMGKYQKLDSDKELALYRIACELLNNIQKHSKAKKVTFQLAYQSDVLTLLVEDDGIGIRSKAKNTDGIGLTNIHARVAYMEAKLTIDDDGKGTVIVIDVPYNKINS